MAPEARPSIDPRARPPRDSDATSSGVNVMPTVATARSAPTVDGVPPRRLRLPHALASTSARA